MSGIELAGLDWAGIPMEKSLAYIGSAENYSHMPQSRFPFAYLGKVEAPVLLMI